jgi:lipopolysaccharide export system protein LptA
MKTGIFTALFFAFLAGVAPAAGGAPAKSDTLITADRMVSENEKGRMRFTGHVEASHKDILLTADEVEVYSTEKKEAVARIIASGNVVVTRGTKKLTGGHAELDYEKKRVVVTGSPAITEKGNTISGEKIAYQYDKEGIIIDGGSGKRATLVLPMPKKENKK